MASRLKVLLVENDDGLRKRLTSALEGDGCDVLPFPGIPDRKIDDLLTDRIDLALVDRKLKDDQPGGDNLGETYAVRLHEAGIHSVLHTAYPPEGSALFDLIRRQRLGGVCWKAAVRFEFLECVRQFARTRTFPNGVARFWVTEKRLREASTAYWEELRSELNGGGATAPPTAEEMVVLLRSLISPCATHVALERHPSGHGGARVLKAEISYGDGPVRETLVIKFGNKSVIASEVIRYDRHVGPLPDGVAAQKRFQAETLNLGAVAYSWVSDSVEDAAPFGPSLEGATTTWWKRRHAAIARLFSRDLDLWYKAYRSDDAVLEADLGLVEYYTGPGGVWYEEISLQDLELPPQDVDLPSPIRATRRYWDFGQHGRLFNPVVSLTGGEVSDETFGREAASHGDLHVGNVYILPDDAPRLIDFGRTAVGHVFRDFVALESSIRLTCVVDHELKHLREAEDCLSGTSSLGDYIDYRSLTGSWQLQEAVRAAMLIRRAALDALGNLGEARIDMRHYLISLGLHMLRYASGEADELKRRKDDVRKSVRVWHAMYAAAKAVAAITET